MMGVKTRHLKNVISKHHNFQKTNTNSYETEVTCHILLKQVLDR
jgi:hypothetical protein